MEETQVLRLKYKLYINIQNFKIIYRECLTMAPTENKENVETIFAKPMLPLLNQMHINDEKIADQENMVMSKRPAFPVSSHAKRALNFGTQSVNNSDQNARVQNSGKFILNESKILFFNVIFFVFRKMNMLVTIFYF